MSASIFGPLPSSFANAQNYTVLSDGTIAVLYQNTGNGSSATNALLVQFLAPDGTPLGAPVNLDPTGSGNFNSGSNDQIVALPDGGFAVLAEHYDPTNGTSDFLASFDSQGNPVNGWTQVNAGVDGGMHALLALNDNGSYVAWATDANANTQITVAPGQTVVESTDEYGATYTTGGALVDQQIDGNAQTGTTAGQQRAGNPIQLTNGSVVVFYTDTAYYPGGGSYNLGYIDNALSMIIGSGAPITVFAPSSGGSPTQLDGDDHAAVALANGSFAVVYTLVVNPYTPNTVFDTYAKFYNADGTLAAQNTSADGVFLFERTGLDGSGSYADSAVSVAALPDGGFAVGYITHPSGSTQSQVGLYDASGNLVQTVALATTSGAQSFPSLTVAPDGSLYATATTQDIAYHIVGTTPGDYVLDASADTAAETLTGISTTNNWIYAGAGDTTIIGGPGSFDHIYAGTGTDSILGGTTQNFIEAGAGKGAIDGNGGITTVFFDANEADYAVYGMPSDFTVTNIATGAIDTLTNVQTLQFANGSVSTASVSCFCPGTLIASERGGVAIEHLAIGERVLTCARPGQPAQLRPIKWIGHRHLDCRNHPRPENVRPVRVRAGAFGDHLPQRDLFLSPDHAVFADGALIPIRHLINDFTIAQEQRDEVAYWHVELGVHDVLLAEGLPCESYLDTGNRNAFSNAAVGILHPTFGRNADSAWTNDACAELVESGPRLGLMRDHLADRAARLGYPVRGVHDIRIEGEGRISAIVPGHIVTIRLSSASCRVGGDSRLLGALVTGLRVDGIAVALDDISLIRGFQEVEMHGAKPVRWTDGAGIFTLGAAANARLVEIDVATMSVERAERRAA
jgi:hypothetical protein